MSTVTTHVLDAALGGPATGVRVRLERLDPQDGRDPQDGWGRAAISVAVADARTDHDGRVGVLGPDRLGAGSYRLVFDTGGYFARDGRACFYPEVAVTFLVTDTGQHFHLPLLLSPYAYSTYRGS